jgi:3-deoxy-D-manno-octulosonate 8-phosphate phosphatase (KDO 8-P phosphatase)
MHSTSDDLDPQLLDRLRPIRLLCLDVDGVLTDGHLYFAGGAGWQDVVPEARWTQRFSVRDGVGIKLLQQAGGQVAILSEGGLISGRARAESLRIEHAYFGLTAKLERFQVLLTQLRLVPEQAAFIGDELADLPMLGAVGFAATVPDAVAEVRAAAHYVTTRPGGSGAVREVADLIRRYGSLGSTLAASLTNGG